MKTPLEVSNGFCFIPNIAPASLIRALDVDTAYLVSGHELAPAFKKRYWDGREHLVKWSKKRNGYLMPTGLLPDLVNSSLAGEFDFIDKRRAPAPARELSWIGYEPRAHQVDAVEAALVDRGLSTGRGLLNLPIRSGKTLTAAHIIHKLGLRTLFVVPSDLLLQQTVAEFKKFLAPAPVGIAGGGKWAPDWITVATNQTLIANAGRAAPLLAQTDLLFVDEAHHLEAPAWRAPLLQCDAMYKLGLSATIFANKDIPAEQSAIWLKAVTGPILHRVSMKQLFDLGLLVPPNIVIYPVDQPESGSWAKYGWQTVYTKLIAENLYRNQGIADLVKQGVERGMRVLVDTGRHSQMRALVEYVKARGISCAAISGKTPKDARKHILSKFNSGELMSLVGTVLGEGVDIPELEMVINAEGLQSKKAGIQRMRNLTPAEGKESAIFIDFADLTHRILREHSMARLQTYKSIRGFKIQRGIVQGDRFVLPK